MWGSESTPYKWVFMTCALPCQGPQCLQPTGMARPSSVPSADTDSVCTKCRPHQTQLPLLHDRCLQRPPHYSPLPVQLHIIKAVFLGSDGATSSECPPHPVPAFRTCLWFLHSLSSTPESWVSQNLSLKLTEFERNPQEVIMNYTMILIKKFSTLGLWEKKTLFMSTIQSYCNNKVSSSKSWILFSRLVSVFKLMTSH